MTAAERQSRYRATHGRRPEPGNAARQRRWRARRAAEVVAEATAVVTAMRMAEVSTIADPLFLQAAAVLMERGELDLVGRLQASWPHMTAPVREEMAAGRGFRFWLRD
jgi:hypothetical protein